MTARVVQCAAAALASRCASHMSRGWSYIHWGVLHFASRAGCLAGLESQLMLYAGFCLAPAHAHSVCERVRPRFYVLMDSMRAILLPQQR